MNRLHHDQVLHDLKATSHRSYTWKQKICSYISQPKAGDSNFPVKLFFFLSGKLKLYTFRFFLLYFRESTWMILEDNRDQATRNYWNNAYSSHSYFLNHVGTGDTVIYVCEVVPHSRAGLPAWGGQQFFVGISGHSRSLVSPHLNSYIESRDSHPGTPNLSPTTASETRTCHVYIYLQKEHRNVGIQYKRGVQNWQLLNTHSSWHFPYIRIYINMFYIDITYIMSIILW